MARGPDYDVVFAGGGLASGLMAYRLAQLHPSLKIGIVEAGTTLGGNHTWSFHASDISSDAEEWLDPFITYRWDSQSVMFPARQRSLATGYRSLTAERFHDCLVHHPRLACQLGAKIVEAGPNHLTLDDGRTLSAPVIFDGRGPVATADLDLGFQKFLGLELELDAPHGLTAPIIMDATVPQTDGYRFVYVLPFSETKLLIEDTYYADGFDLPAEHLKAEAKAYATARGWTIKRIIREEVGVLPIVLDGAINRYWEGLEGGPAPIGLRAGLFHPITGYSIGEAVRLADMIAASPPTSSKHAFVQIENYARKRWRQHSFYRLLNRMLFRAAAPEKRYIVLERFYGLPHGLIERFYAGDSSLADQLRILAGKPPVPLGRALRAFPPAHRGRPIEEGLLG